MLLRGALVVVGLSVLAASALAQPPTERPAANAQRAAAVKAKGTQLTGDHIIVWFTPALTRQEVESIVRRLDPTIGEAKRVIGKHDWQRIGNQKITYYFVDESFIANSSSEGEVFIPAEFIKQEGRAPFLGLAIQELLTPKRPFPLGETNDPDVRLADFVFSIWHGVGDYIATAVKDRTAFVETGSVDLGKPAAVDALCAQRLGGVDSAKVVPYMGAAGRPRELFGPERTKYAPPFNTCAMSFAKFLIERSSLQSVIGLMNKLPDGVKAVQAEIQRITGQAVTTVRDEWQRKIGLKSASSSPAVDIPVRRTPDGRPDLQGTWHYDGNPPAEIS